MGKHNKPATKVSREIVFAQDGQGYAKVLACLGDSRFKLKCDDGQEKLGIARGKIAGGRGGNWITVDDYVLISHRDFQDKKVDIIMKYTSEEAKKLIKWGNMDFKDDLMDKLDKEENNDENPIDIQFDDV